MTMTQEFSQAKDFIWLNREWLFSGAGIAAIGVVFSILRLAFGRRNSSFNTTAPRNSNSLPNKTPSGGTSPYIYVGEQTKKLGIKMRSRIAGGASWAEIFLSYRVTSIYKFIYHSKSPYEAIQPIIESDSRFEFSAISLEKLIARRQQIEGDLLLKFQPLFEKHGMTLDSVKILDVG